MSHFDLGLESVMKYALEPVWDEIHFHKLYTWCNKFAQVTAQVGQPDTEVTEDISDKDELLMFFF